ncbi:MAG: ribosomal RNA small subunit methyltransferase A [Methanobacteriota archaeon]|nr:MAG: ribosomal RNA small subunit methyltransferase A [Euryarchaeota archaeon]
MRADEVRTILESLGKRPSKRLGQHFLIDERVLNRQVALAELSEEDTVLEIGPGIGNLTEAILASGASVVAVERDDEFCRFLRRRFGERIALIQGDAVRAFLPEFDKVVANLPYKISSPMTFKLLDKGFKRAVVMVQREFAERMTAEPGTCDYGRLSVGVYYRSTCEISAKVGRGSFWPQPDVDSCLVTLSPREPPFAVADERTFFDVTKAIFSHRRKKIMNALASDPIAKRCASEAASAAFAELPNADKRAEELSPEEIGELSDAFLELTRSPRRTG